MKIENLRSDFWKIASLRSWPFIRAAEAKRRIGRSKTGSNLSRLRWTKHQSQGAAVSLRAVGSPKPEAELPTKTKGDLKVAHSYFKQLSLSPARPTKTRWRDYGHYSSTSHKSVSLTHSPCHSSPQFCRNPPS